MAGEEIEAAAADAIESAPAEIRDAFRQMTSDPVLWSYLDIIEASKPSDEVFFGLTGDRDPVVAALAISALASTDGADAEGMAAQLLARVETPSPLVDEALGGVDAGGP